MSQLPAEIREAATHGSYCPKMCTFACPVTAATGRNDAVPWSFHRAVAALAGGDEQAGDPQRLVACTGCYACRQPCAWDQDVPAQVRAGRAASPPHTPAADAAVVALAAGRRPDGSAVVGTATAVANKVVVLAGCQDEAPAVVALGRLIAAAGMEVVTLAAPGCCGQLATDLGAADVAAERREATAALLTGAATVVATDPHCLPSLRTALPDMPVTDPWTLLADALERLSFDGDATTVTYQDPCVLARGEGVTAAPRQLLDAAGITLAEPEQTDAGTGCTGAGMALPLLDATASEATAARRAEQLHVAGGRVATACARSGRQLAAAGVAVEDLGVLLAGRLVEQETA